MPLYTAADRDRVRVRVFELADADARVVSGAAVGSLTTEAGDRWSDLDLTFGVAEDASVLEVLEDWSTAIEDELGGVQLFDLPSGPSIYRVFLMPGCLQFDLSFTPQAEFGATSPRFQLLFGTIGVREHTPPPDRYELFGYGVHHAVRSRFAIERGRSWYAEYWTAELRHYAMHLACLNRDLPARYGRAFDELPEDVRVRFAGAIARSLDRDELLRAFRVALDGFIAESKELAAPVEADLRLLAHETL